VQITTVTEVQMRNMKCHWSSRELSEFIEIAIDATIVINEHGIISHANLRAEKLLEYPRAELIGQAMEILVPEASRSNHSLHRQSFVNNPTVREMGKYVDLTVSTKSGKEIPVSIGLSPFESDQQFQILVAIRDNALLHEAKARIDDYIAEIRNITETAIDAIITMDKDSKIISWNDAATHLFGYSREETIGQQISIIIPKRMRRDHFNGVANISRGGKSKVVGKTVEVEGLRKSGDTFPLSLSITTWMSKRGRIFCGILRDITLRVEAEKKITEQNKKLQLISITDPLTGAYNRRQFDFIGNKEFSRSRRNNKPYSVLMLDIDHFKAINDTYGHELGDKALKEAVSVIQQAIRQEDSLFRLGGEEFAVILPETSLMPARKLAERIRAAIENIELDTAQGLMKYTISIGLAEFSTKDEGIGTTLSHADKAMYSAKSLGRNRVEQL